MVDHEGGVAPGVLGRSRIVLCDADVLSSRVLRDYLVYAAYEGVISTLAEIGPLSAGSLSRRTSPGCRCRADPARLRGAYLQLTRQVDGKSTTRRLTHPEARSQAQTSRQ